MIRYEQTTRVHVNAATTQELDAKVGDLWNLLMENGYIYLGGDPIVKYDPETGDNIDE